VTFKGSGSGTVVVNDSGASGASGLTVTGAPGGSAITVSGTQVVSGSETVDYGGIAKVTVRGGSGPNAITVDAASNSGVNLFVDGSSGSTTLSVVDVTGGGVVHGSLATGEADVHYLQGASSQVSFANVQQLQLNPSAAQSYAQSLFMNVLGTTGSPADLQPTLNLLNAPNGGRRQAVVALELSPAGRLHTVDSWFRQYTGGPAGPYVEQFFASALKKQTEEQVLSRLLGPVFTARTGGGVTSFLEVAGQALFGRALTRRELARFRNAFAHGGRQAALLAMLKSPGYRSRLVATYVRQLLRVPAGQPLSPSLQALVQQLSSSRMDQRNIRIFLESSDQFFAQG
jgi:hypothetical protein